MIARTSQRVPKLRRQKKPRGTPDLAFVELEGRRVYLGKYGTAESQEAYHHVIGEWLSNARHLQDEAADIRIVEVVDRFIEHARDYYRRPDGTITTEPDNYAQAVRLLVKLYADTPARDFGPRSLKTVRDRMVDLRWCRTHINKQINRVRHVFKWAVEMEMMPVGVYQALQTVTPLKRGRSEAAERPPVKPVPDAHVKAVLPHVSRQVAALVNLQLLSAARAGELVLMRPIDLDTSGRVWVYNPESHKTAHHDKKRHIYLGPRAQEVIKPFLAGRSVDSFMLSPAEAEAEHRQQKHAQRKTPTSCGNVAGSNRKRKPRRVLGDHYTTASYRRAIERACFIAKVSKWTPHRLRHSAGTHVRKEFGVEAAQVMLGHARADVTQIYAEANAARAVEVASKIG